MRNCATALLLIVMLTASAAMAADDGIFFGGHGGIHFGGLYWDVSDLNKYFDSANVDTLPSVLPAIGGGGQAIIFGGIVIGARGSISQYHLDGDTLTVDIGVSYGFVDLGYAVINKKRWLLTPVAGVGGFSVRMGIDGELSALDLHTFSKKYDSRQPDARIEDKLTMSTSSAIGHIGLMFYHEIRFAETDGGGFANFLIGASTGWMFEVSHTGWQIDSDDVKDGPNRSPHGAYLQMELHFGGGTAGNPEKMKSKGSMKVQQKLSAPAPVPPDQREAKPPGSPEPRKEPDKTPEEE